MGSPKVAQPQMIAPAPPPAEEDATVVEALTPEDELKRKRKAQKDGAKSLQIPLLEEVFNTNSMGG